jgi:ParB-like chromosome segregation protein Spo0J
MIDPQRTRMERELVDPEAIRVDGGTQARAKGLDLDKVAEYAESYLAGVGLPAVVVYYDGEDYWCADGHHRVAAAIQAEMAEIDCDIHEGDRRDALRYALGANSAHGLARSNADKRNAVALALDDEEWASLSDREIARMCAVSHTMVANLRRERMPEEPTDVLSELEEDEDEDEDEDEAEASSELDTDDIDGAAAWLAKHLRRSGPNSQRPQQLSLARNCLADQLGMRAIPDADWEEILDEGELTGIWATKKAVIGGRLLGEIWLTDKDRTEGAVKPTLPSATSSGERHISGTASDRASADEGEAPLQASAATDSDPASEPDRSSALSPEIEEGGGEDEAYKLLPNEERAPRDAYWTPDLHARGIVRWIDERFFASTPPARVLEPSVGGGAFIGPIQDTWPDARIEAIDMDPLAPGLQCADSSTVGDYMEIITSGRYDIVVGNPPYREDLVAWIERSRRSARVVAYLLRGSFAGGIKRQEWFSGSGKPAHVVVISPRPKWEGPGAREQTDQSDSFLFVWVEGHVGPTQMHFVNVRELAQ